MLIGIDLMGGDSPPSELFFALIAALLRTKECTKKGVTLVAFVHTQVISTLEAQLQSQPVHIREAIQFVVTDSYIEMEESPLLAVRRKKNSTMAAGMRMLAAHELDGFVSMGNTGALVATAMLYLPMLPSIERCALLVMLPTAHGDVAVLDVGASIAPKPEHLVEWAKMAIAFRKSTHNIISPTLGLLNVGAEEIKGTDWHKQAYVLLEQTFKKNFLGNIEGREVFQGKIDILVTDGFTGNVFLKTCEGVASFLTDYLAKMTPKLGGARSQPIVAHLHNQFNYSQRPGALLCGVDGVVVKCHGHSNLQAITNGILGAIAISETKALEKMKKNLQ